MSDTYQATYDAVRSKISGGDINSAVESAISDLNLSYYAQQISMGYQEAAAEQLRPCVLLRPSLSIDGNKWCAMYGDNLQDGVCGFGKSPSDAMHDFDRNYHTNLRERDDD